MYFRNETWILGWPKTCLVCKNSVNSICTEGDILFHNLQFKLKGSTFLNQTQERDVFDAVRGT